MMTITQLHQILAGLNSVIFHELFDNFTANPSLAWASNTPDGGATLKTAGACYGGKLRGQTSSCQDLARLVTLEQTGKEPLKGRVAVGWVLDDDVETKDKELPVIVAVGINYGQGAFYLKNKVGWRDPTQMRGRLKKASEFIRGPGTDSCPFAQLPRPFHLVVGNFFPWITTCAWSDYRFNGIEEALLLHCCGFRDPHAFLDALFSSQIGREVTHLFFHGTNTPVPLMGLEFVRRHGALLTSKNRNTDVQVVFCDNLARPSLPVANSVGLCLERTGYNEKDVMELEE
jgi:hypothetical protein